MDNTRRCIDWVAETFRPGEVLFSLMSQYTPQESAEGSLARHVTRSEYRAAVAYMENCGITGRLHPGAHRRPSGVHPAV